MALLTSRWLFDFLSFFVLFFLICYGYFKFHARFFWKRRGVSYTEPVFFIGSLSGFATKKSFSDMMLEMYVEHKNERFFGMWLFTRPLLVIKDLELIKNILVKDFQHFHDRGIKFDKKHEPLSANLVNLDGQQWRNLRVKLTPTFTSGKLKMMFPTMLRCAKELEEHLLEPARQRQTIEFKDMLARLNTDIISSCAFGIETNSIKDPEAEFRVYGRKVFKPTLWLSISGILMNICPEVNKIVTLRQFPTDVSKFFMRVVKETVTYRETHNVHRKDFMDLLIQLKNKGTVEDVDTKYLAESEQVQGDPFTPEILAAQAFVFYAAGFETSSTAMMFVLYELALQPDLQQRVQQEIDSVLQAHDGEQTYETLQDMDLLDRCIQESLRKYGAMPMIMRECTKDYPIPDSHLVIQKGEGVVVPVSALHMDPKYFPDPERFDPDRHTPEEKAKRDHFTYLPFGEGPRICIGNRFALLQSKLGLATILSKYEVHIAETTAVPIQFDKASFFPASKNGMPLELRLRPE